MHLIPAAKSFTNRDLNMLIASDHSCPNAGKPFAINRGYIDSSTFVTCHCEDHCTWYKCRLRKPPSDCLDGANSSWKWNEKGKYWVAQMHSGKESGNDGQINAFIF